MPLLTSCGHPASVSTKPPIERVAPPEATEIPEGAVACPNDPTRRCLSDEQNAQLLRSYETGERKRDRMLCWLLVWFGYPACPAE